MPKLNYNLINLLRLISFLPWCFLVFAIWMPVTCKQVYDVDPNSIKKIEYKATSNTGITKTVVSYAFTYNTPSGKKMITHQRITDWKWCGDHTHNFNGYTFFKNELSNNKKHRIEQLINQHTIVINKWLFPCALMIVLSSLSFIILMYIWHILSTHYDWAICPFVQCDNYVGVYRFCANAIFLGYSEVDIDNYIKSTSNKPNFKDFNKWLNK